MEDSPSTEANPVFLPPVDAFWPESKLSISIPLRDVYNPSFFAAREGPKFLPVWLGRTTVAVEDVLKAIERPQRCMDLYPL